MVLLLYDKIMGVFEVLVGFVDSKLWSRLYFWKFVRFSMNVKFRFLV